MLDGSLKGLLTGIAAVLVFGIIALLAKFAGGGVSKKPGETVLRYGGMFRGVGLMSMSIVVLVLLVFIIGTLTGLAAQAPGSAIGAGVCAGLFFVIGFPLLMEGYRRQVILSETGITARGWFSTGEEIPWEAITKVENKVMSGKFVVRAGKKTVALNHYLEGLDAFAEECKKRLAPDVYGKAFEGPLNRPFL